MICVATETTRQVLAERPIAAERGIRLLDQPSIFIAFLEGSEHRIALANSAYMRRVGFHEVLGRTFVAALREVM